MTITNAEVDLEQQIRRQMATDIVWFTQHYFKDDEGLPFALKDFHVELLYDCASDEEKIIELLPAGFGKTTHVGKHYPIWLLCMDPNVRIRYGSKNANDARARLGAIKSELENNDELIRDFGPFIGDKWREDEINVANRTIASKDPTIRTFGAETSVFGGRSTHVILDDLVTIANSGPSVEDGTRNKVKLNYHQGIKKLRIPGKRLDIRIINTVVDMRDLIHDLGAVHGRMPDETVVRWRSTKGFHVVRKCALDERAMTSLWPEKVSVADLQQEKSEDLISFLKRMQNLTIDPETTSFREEWIRGDASAVPPLPGCLDYSRGMGDLPALDYGAWTKVAGYDPNSGAIDSQTAKYCAYVECAFDRRKREPRALLITDLVRFRKTLPDQEDFLYGRATSRGLAMMLIENNAAQQWILQLGKIQAAMVYGCKIEGHHTQNNKYDPEIGIPNLAGMVKAGLIRLPYGDAYAREMTEILIGEMLTYPQGSTSDLLMGLWFTVLAMRTVAKKSKVRVQETALPAAILGHGMTADAIERFYPTKRMF